MSIRDRYLEIINGMKSEDKQVQWETMLKWCQLWIDVENRELKPLLGLIKELKEIGFWTSYYPSQSHCALGLSPGNNYDERYHLPMVYISYYANEDNFAIQYQKGQGGETIRKEIGNKISQDDFTTITNWLNNDDNKRT